MRLSEPTDVNPQGVCPNAGREADARAIVEGMTDEENLPVLVVTDSIAYTDDERLLVDSQPVTPVQRRTPFQQIADRLRPVDVLVRCARRPAVPDTAWSVPPAGAWRSR
jgi:hypothetical protein